MMDSNSYRKQAEEYLNRLCAFTPSRRTGSPGNKAAGAFIADTFRHLGYGIDTTKFDCIDYSTGRIVLEGHDRGFPVTASPFSPPVNTTAPVVVATTLDELKKSDCAGKILLLKGDIAAEPLMPKNFTFYNPEHHRQLYALLEQKQPAAIITAPPKNPALGGSYPYPMFEDGDFDIPSAYCTCATGGVIARSISPLRLIIQSRRSPSTASNVIGRINLEAAEKIVVCAHFDTKDGTPGATDNASGVAILLLLAEMLADYRGKLGIELWAVNGEDHYSAGGEMDYLRRYGQKIGDTVLAINVDGAGYRTGKTAFSGYNLPCAVDAAAKAAFKKFEGMSEGEQWYQGDHMLFVQAGRPSLAITSEKAMELLSSVTHTATDTPDIVDCNKLVEAAQALNNLVRTL
jgi:aminopeptidase YwaD